jgi:hypothetical protein
VSTKGCASLVRRCRLSRERDRHHSPEGSDPVAGRLHACVRSPLRLCPLAMTSVVSGPRGRAERNPPAPRQIVIPRFICLSSDVTRSPPCSEKSLTWSAALAGAELPGAHHDRDDDAQLKKVLSEPRDARHRSSSRGSRLIAGGSSPLRRCRLPIVGFPLKRLFANADVRASRRRRRPCSPDTLFFPPGEDGSGFLSSKMSSSSAPDCGAAYIASTR